MGGGLKRNLLDGPIAVKPRSESEIQFNANLPAGNTYCLTGERDRGFVAQDAVNTRRFYETYEILMDTSLARGANDVVVII